MRRILIAILIVLILTLGILIVLRGAKIFNFEILSYDGLKIKNGELQSKIEEASRVTGVTFQEKLASLKSASKDLVTTREDYQYKVAYSSEEDVKRAREIKNYQVDFLFTKLGNYQSKYGIDMDLAADETSATGVYDLNFTLHGKYVWIADFIRAIENDSSLNFIIENFLLERDEGSTETLKATFKVTGLSLEVDETIKNSDVTSMNDSEKNTSNKNNTTNTTNNNNTTNRTTNNTTGNTTNNTANNTTNNTTNNNDRQADNNVQGG